eukprot:11164558-Lingulodinium_polyedra.AAC.1
MRALHAPWGVPAAEPGANWPDAHSDAGGQLVSCPSIAMSSCRRRWFWTARRAWARLIRTPE